MNNQCLNKVRPCIDNRTGLEVSDPDSPVRNLSSESPDEVVYRVFVPGSENYPDDPTRLYRAQGCLSLCESTISMEEALLCAQRQAAICTLIPEDPDVPNGPFDPAPWSPPSGITGGSPNTPGGGGGGTPSDPNDPNTPTTPTGGDPTAFYSSPATCTVLCPDGTPFTKTVPAGAFVAKTQALADKKAQEYACQQAALLRVCLYPIDDIECCLYEAIDPVTILFGGSPGPFELEAIGLPGGLEVTKNIGGSSATLSGTPSSVGSNDVTIRVTGPQGDKAEKSFNIKTFGIAPPPSDLGEHPVFVPYSRSFAAVGPVAEPLTWTGQGLPSGITMDPATGTISGTPLSPGTTFPTISFLDNEGRVCTNVYRLRIVDCAVESYQGDTEQQIDSPLQFSQEITKRPCERVVTFKTIGFRANLQNCNSGATIQVKVFDGAHNQQGSAIAAITNPFPAEIDWDVTIPAQYLPEDLPWTYEVTVLINALSPAPEECSAGGGSFTFTVTGL